MLKDTGGLTQHCQMQLNGLMVYNSPIASHKPSHNQSMSP